MKFQSFFEDFKISKLSINYFLIIVFLNRLLNKTLNLMVIWCKFNNSMHTRNISGHFFSYLYIILIYLFR